MFALRVNIPGRHIGLKMTLRTRERLSRNFDRETMARVACRAGTEASVRILPSHALIGPVDEIGDFDIPDTCCHGLHSPYLHFCSMASVAGFMFCRGGSIGMMHCRPFDGFHAKHTHKNNVGINKSGSFMLRYYGVFWGYFLQPRWITSWNYLGLSPPELGCRSGIRFDCWAHLQEVF